MDLIKKSLIMCLQKCYCNISVTATVTVTEVLQNERDDGKRNVVTYDHYGLR